MGAYFGGLAVDFGSVGWQMLGLALTFLVMALGVTKGIEKMNKVMMPVFFLFFIILLIRVATLPGAAEGYRYMFVPKWEQLGDIKTWVYALSLIHILARTTFGANIYMLGTNVKAAGYSGIKVRSYTLKLFVIGGILAALGGMVMMSRTNSAKADYGEAYTLQCVMIAILGGVDAQGGAGKVRSVVVAIFIVQIISSAINMFPVLNTYTKTLIWGLTLIAVMVWRMFSKD